MLEIIENCSQEVSSEVKSLKWSEKLSNVEGSECNKVKWSERSKVKWNEAKWSAQYRERGGTSLYGKGL